MDALWSAYAAALTLGAAHALEVDHMVAVTTLVGGRPRVLPAVAFGLRWGLGHAVAVLVAGGVLAASGVSVPRSWESRAELGVGLMMIALGVWAARNAGRLHVHDAVAHSADAGHHRHAHLHAHADRAHPHDHARIDAGRKHRHLPTIVGALHGLAGAAPVAVLIPVTLIGDLRFAVGYLAAFGIGTTAAMGVFAGVAAAAMGGAARTVRALRLTGYATGAASLAVGVIWIARALGAT